MAALAPDAQPINDILVSDGELGGEPSPLSLHFDHREIGEVLGHIVENRHIRRALLAEVAHSPVSACFRGVAVDATASRANGVAVTLSDGRTSRAPLAVAAEGRESPLREAQGIGVGQPGTIRRSVS